MSYSNVIDHRSMALDLRRNQAYLTALEKVITPDSVVLDLGAGLGTLGLLAAQLGAKQVYLVEPADVITVTQEIVDKNGLSDRVKCLHGKIEDIDLPEPVDVVVSVFTGNFLLSEDLLPSLFYARDHYLKEGGVLIPQAAIMEAVPVEVPELYQSQIDCWVEPHLGIDHSPARSYAAQSMYYYTEELSKAKYLAEPAKLMSMDFYTSKNTHCKVEVDYKIKESGTCHGWAGWFQMQLLDTWLSTSPHAPALHWSPTFLPLESSTTVSAGEEVKFWLERPPFGDWYWRVKTDTIQQTRSTFFSTSMTLKTIKKSAFDYHPQLTPKGKAVLYILENCGSHQSVKDLSLQIQTQNPTLFKNEQAALTFVQNIVMSFA